ncbi:MAG: hypothetical protein K1X78_01175 [Verrucomicrobiaceae bacterium]|nr:hypothetical protein [Verrucomicrobiaceae bacterium]
MSTAVSQPSPEAVLRRLFWKLLFRGRAVQQAGAQRTRRQMGLAFTLFIYAVFGAMPAILAVRANCFALAVVLHGFTFMFASLTLASSAGTMLFMKEEAEILLHRPVTPRELLRAKCAVLAGFSLLLAFALNIGGFVAGPFCKGATWRFVPVHLLSTVLLMVFSAASIVLVYNACLKWFGRERFDNLLTFMQTILSVAMMVSGQIVPRLIGFDAVTQIDHVGGWMLALPPVWFGALDGWLAADLPGAADLWLPALIGVGVTAIVSWLAFERLASAYGEGLMSLNESTGAIRESTRPRGRVIAWLVQVPPLSWWLRDAVERQSFILTTAYCLRDREIKLRLYPGLAPMLFMPVVMSVSGATGGGETAAMIQGFVTCFLAIVPLQAMMMLRCSEHWRASEFFHAAPVPHWMPFFDGARKATLAFLAFPLVVLVTSLLCAIARSLTPLILAVPSLVLLPAFSQVTGVVEPWLPLSKPSDEMKNSAAGCMMMAGVMMAAAVVGGLASASWRFGWFPLYLAVEIAAATGASFVMRRIMSETRWLPERS